MKIALCKFTAENNYIFMLLVKVRMNILALFPSKFI